jgi:hypothetical protein
MQRPYFLLAFGLALLLGGLFAADALNAQSARGGPVFITDRHGERWEVTQAVSLGFAPRGFQHGIGRYAFTPLSDADLATSSRGVPGRTRVIGVAGEKEDQAYAIATLVRHEIANTHVDGKPIAVGH